MKAKAAKAGALMRVLAGPVARGLLSPLMYGRTPVFMLHRVEDSSAGIHGHSTHFVRQALSALRDSGASFVSLRTLIAAWKSGTRIDPNAVAFTIDDGFADQEVLVREAFAPLQCPVTVFLISGFLDRKIWPWDDQLALSFRNATVPSMDFQIAGHRFALTLGSARERNAAKQIVRECLKSQPGLDVYAVVSRIAQEIGAPVPREVPVQYAPMTWDVARAMERDGVAEFAPHSVTHRIISRLTSEESREEIETSWGRLQTELRDPLPLFAWPTGRRADFTARDVGLAYELGLRGCVSTITDYACRGNQQGNEFCHISRFALPNDLSTVLRYGSWVERARQLIPVCNAFASNYVPSWPKRRLHRSGTIP